MPLKKANRKYHYKNWRSEEYKRIDAFISDADMLALTDLSGLPAGANADFRKVLKDNGFKVKMSNLNVIKKVLESHGLTELKSNAKGSLAIIAGKGSPFAMYSLIKKNASNAGAKIGLEAPVDIIVPEGKTNIPPGPALSDFKAVKIDTQIRDGKIYVPKNYTIAKKGDTIDAKVVAILTKLNIKPIKVLLNIRSAYDKKDKILYPISVLDIDYEALKNEIMVAYNNAYLLALERAIINKVTIKPLIGKAYRNTKAVALSENILTKDTVGDIFGKAFRQANAINKKVNN
jgi:large subunit ribosomal protein L10